MKKVLFSLLLIALCSSTLMAQIRFTPEIGGSFSNYRFEELLNDWYDAKNRTSYLIGASVDLPLVAGLYLQPRVYYVKKGSDIESEILAPWDQIEINGSSVDVYDNYKEELNYLEVPILLKYQFLGGAYGFHIAVGPNLALGLSGTSKMTLTDANGNENAADINYNDHFEIEPESDIEFGSSASDDYEAFDLGISVGGGVYFESGSGQIVLDIRYVRGLKDMYGDDYAEEIIQYNNNVYITLGYSIPLLGGYE